MSKLTIPKNYSSALNLHDTQLAIKTVKDFFQGMLAQRLSLTRVSAPLFVDPTTGLNDNLNGYERPVTFGIQMCIRDSSVSGVDILNRHIRKLFELCILHDCFSCRKKSLGVGIPLTVRELARHIIYHLIRCPEEMCIRDSFKIACTICDILSTSRFALRIILLLFSGAISGFPSRFSRFIESDVSGVLSLSLIHI